MLDYKLICNLTVVTNNLSPSVAFWLCKPSKPMNTPACFKFSLALLGYGHIPESGTGNFKQYLTKHNGNRRISDQQTP